jgi:hypothetical protein
MFLLRSFTKINSESGFKIEIISKAHKNAEITIIDFIHPISDFLIFTERLK